MLFVCLLEFFGILTLTYISMTIMEIETKIVVEELVKDTVDEMELWLFRMDRVLGEKHMPNVVYNSVINQV